MSIGSKLKELRKKQGLTQSALSNGIVTRNMLSLIENGLAKPSLGTIQAFAERLNVPIEYLISDKQSANVVSFSKMDSIKDIKILLKNGEYAKCLEEGEKLGEPDDELALILMRCSAILGEQDLKLRNIGSAYEHFEKAKKYSEMTIYGTAEEITKINRYFGLVDAIVYKKTFSDIPKTSFSLSDELAAYIAAYYNVDIGDFPLLPEHRTHIAINKIAKNGRYNDATRAYADQLRITNDKLTRYYLLRSLEECFRKMGDPKGSFESAAERRAAFEELIGS